MLENHGRGFINSPIYIYLKMTFICAKLKIITSFIIKLLKSFLREERGERR